MGYGMMNFGRLLDDTIFVDKFPSYTHQPTMVFPRVCWGYTPQKFNIAPENWWPRKTIRLSYWVSVTFQGRTVKLRGGYLKHPKTSLVACSFTLIGTSVYLVIIGDQLESTN